MNGFDAIVDFFENLFPADMFGNQVSDINSNAKKSSATATDEAVVTPKEKRSEQSKLLRRAAEYRLAEFLITPMQLEMRVKSHSPI